MKWIPKGVFVLSLVFLLYFGFGTLTHGLNHTLPAINPDGSAPSLPVPASNKFDFHPIMQVVVSVSLLGACLFVILSRRFQPKDKHWAYTTIGTLVGFWLPK